MSKLNKPLTAFALAALTLCADTHARIGEPDFHQIGRSASAKEIAAWDIDVRPDFQGLPAGAGSVGQGQKIWDGKCASCHGTFGESNQVFSPVVGGTTPADIKSGRVAALANNSQPQRTTLMKLATLSTLWDYINRAMPWNAPKTLHINEVYAVTAYILNMGEIVADDFILSDHNIDAVQKTLPNRDGMTRAHGLWDINGKPDTQNIACMHQCAPEIKLASSLPDSARNAHGNLADQNRPFGAVRGIQTALLTTKLAANDATGGAAASPPKRVDVAKLAEQRGCGACHDINDTVLGPSFKDIAAKYKGDAKAPAQLALKVKQGSVNVWSDAPMPPQTQVSDDDIKTILEWVLNGAN